MPLRNPAFTFGADAADSAAGTSTDGAGPAEDVRTAASAWAAAGDGEGSGWEGDEGDQGGSESAPLIFAGSSAGGGDAIVKDERTGTMVSSTFNLVNT